MLPIFKSDAIVKLWLCYEGFNIVKIYVKTCYFFNRFIQTLLKKKYIAKFFHFNVLSLNNLYVNWCFYRINLSEFEMKNTTKSTHFASYFDTFNLHIRTNFNIWQTNAKDAYRSFWSSCVCCIDLAYPNRFTRFEHR